MDLQDDVCYCFHVPLGKLLNFARRTQPRVASQMSECLGAGTGCGWCIPTLERIVEAVRGGQTPNLAISPAEYEAQRALYRARRREARANADEPTPGGTDRVASDDAEHTA